MSLLCKLSHVLLILVLFLSIYNDSNAQTREPVTQYVPKPYFTQGTDTPVINLNGAWSFSESPTQSFWEKPKASKLNWKNINVPGEWYMQGFEVEENTKAAYFREIEIPSSWDGKIIYLKCDGVYSSSLVYVNGKLAGGHEGGLTPFELDLTDLIRAGKKNTLVIGVQSESLADTLASATQYAAHQLGGITRKLELYAVPQIFIKGVHYNTILSDNREDAQLVVDLVVQNKSRKTTANTRIKVNLAQKGGPSILFPDNSLDVPKINSGEEKLMQFRLDVPKARLWDPEHPNLYKVDVILSDEGSAIQKISSKIGLREIEVVGNKVFVNGSPIKLRGVNRHEVHPLKGRSLSVEEWLADAKLFKEANVNYIRTSHYPPGEEFISICDSIGLFVECEAPLCWIGHGANNHWINNDPHDEKLYPLIRQMILETIAQYRNHPSVILWSMANESAWGPNWAKVLEEVKSIDPSRPFTFHDQAYGGFNNYGSVDAPVANMHYPGPDGPSVAWKFERPLLFGEYAHLNTYNRQEIVTDPGVRDAWGRGLESMWENMYYSAGCLGGAIWSGIDDVFYLPSGKAVGYGEWGPIDGWRRPKPEYYHMKKIYSPIKILQRELEPLKKGENQLKIALENRHLFTNMSEIDIAWSIGNQQGRAEMDLEAGQSGILELTLHESPAKGESLNVEFHSPQGYLIDQYAFTFEEDEVVSESAVEESPVPELVVTDNLVSIKSGESTWLINPASGKLENVRKGSTTLITAGPELMMLPLRTGPCNTEHSLHIEPLNSVCTNWQGEVSGSGKEGNAVFVEVKGSYDEADVKLLYWFGRTRGIEIEYEIIPKDDIDPRQIGLVFEMPMEFENFSWERTGQWSLYPGDHLGRTKGSARPFPKGKLTNNSISSLPDDIWEMDFHPMGINDFRATRDKLIWGSLENSSGMGIILLSDGSGAMRPFVEDGKIKFLAAGFSTAGGDLFFSSHLRKERNPLAKGQKFKAKMFLDLL